MASNSKNQGVDAFSTIVSALTDLDTDSQKRILQAVMTFLDISWDNYEKLHGSPREVKGSHNYETNKGQVSFSDNRDMSPKEFLKNKSPQKDTERVVCLAYYLTHYRDMPHFKTIDLSVLNTEAAQPKFSNTAVAVENATKSGLLVQAAKGTKQISAIGEVFVQALPDRESALKSITNMRPKRRNKSGRQKNAKSNKK